jgi:hypothetical protein
MAAPKMPKIQRFRGLNNVADPLTLGAEWLVQADNVDVTDHGKLQARVGYDLALAGAFTGAYATDDFTRMYVVDAGALKAMAGNTAAVTLQAGLADADMHWAEVNGHVFFNNGTDSGIIKPDHAIIPWAWTIPAAPQLAAVTGSLAAGLYQVRCTFTLADGRMTGASDAAELVLEEGQALQISAIPQEAGCTTNVFIAPANSTVYGLAASNAPAALVWNASPDDLGRELTTAGLEPLPAGCEAIAHWKGRICAAEYLPTSDQTVIWVSEPLGFHLFNLSDGEAFMVPGHVLMLAGHDLGLVIGTDQAILARTADGLVTLADYGVVPGQHASQDNDKTLLFWSTRGVCRALPFSNLTEQNVSVAPGLKAGGAIVQRGGQKRYLVAVQQGGSAFNQR